MTNQDFSRQVRAYLIAGVVCLVLTVAVYAIVTARELDPVIVAACALIAACIQFIVQSRYFLHVSVLGRNNRVRMHGLVFIFSIVMLAAVVIGSLWVMYNLNYNMGMTPDEMTEYMIQQNKKGF